MDNTAGKNSYTENQLAASLVYRNIFSYMLTQMTGAYLLPKDVSALALSTVEKIALSRKDQFPDVDKWKYLQEDSDAFGRSAFFVLTPFAVDSGKTSQQSTVSSSQSLLLHREIFLDMTKASPACSALGLMDNFEGTFFFHFTHHFDKLFRKTLIDQTKKSMLSKDLGLDSMSDDEKWLLENLKVDWKHPGDIYVGTPEKEEEDKELHTVLMTKIFNATVQDGELQCDVSANLMIEYNSHFVDLSDDDDDLNLEFGVKFTFEVDQNMIVSVLVAMKNQSEVIAKLFEHF